MTKIFIINGGQHFAHSGGKFNQTLVQWDKSFFTSLDGFEVQITDINEPYDLEEEVSKFVWADVVIYHTPVWWFGLPHKFKEYLDTVFTAGHRKGIYYSDGRKRENPEINYGTGGSLHGRHYMLTTTWNAPETAFTLPGEFFDQNSVDEGVMFGFHRMNAFTGMKQLEGFHFHDLEKNARPDRIQDYFERYTSHLAETIQSLPLTITEEKPELC
ncbi:NAD(P)H-dependent oxidoreductase [Niabella yanshanensis]|uniref:NAD(P)H-dependent oxidoreductase n=1 Tax=Niabella yanshanensis TaxID=577386 RepID=A0ABZ0WBU8_9BACT|nr:NAD(P)H-dependent oxidoreductase [Niabella yanshanensis]WQD40017.1 NAD(P)H-dependent oxidoreductase [Niabella yanshanensis]